MHKWEEVIKQNIVLLKKAESDTKELIKNAKNNNEYIINVHKEFLEQIQTQIKNQENKLKKLEG